MRPEIWQFMSVRDIWTDKPIQFDDYQEPEWNDAYYECPEYKDYESEWN